MSVASYFIFVQMIFIGMVQSSIDLENKDPIVKDFEILEYEIKSDTLSIVAYSEYLYGPFGIFSSLEAFTNSQVLFKECAKLRFKSENFYYRFCFKESYIDIFYSDYNQKVDVVSGHIIDKQIVLKNNIKIGISKKDFLNKFTDSITLDQLRKTNVIEFVSAITGIWHYYIFEEDILLDITFKTDYQILE